MAVLLLLISSMLTGLAQLPDMIQLLPDSSKLERLTGLEKARMYYGAGQYVKSESLLFIELENGTMQSEDFLMFANCLMATGKRALASDMFKEYQRLSGNEYGAVADMVSGLFMLDSAKVPIERVFTTTEGVHSASFYDGKIYSAKNGSLYSYIASCPGELDAGTYMGLNISGISSVTFFNGGFSAVLSAYDPKTERFNLYEVEREGANWSKAKRLKFCDPEINYLHPTLDEEKGILYFSSDAAGGSGGFDLYLSYYSGSKFGEAINLGSNINTNFNELYPNSLNGWLYFSSNGYPTNGGYDLFRYKMLDEFTPVVKNVKTYNSRFDELAIVMQDPQHFIINRNTSSGLFLLSSTLPGKKIEFKGRILDEKQNAIDNAAVLLLSDAQYPHYSLSNSKGGFRIINEGSAEEVNVRIFASGYYAKQFILRSNEKNELVLQKIENVSIVKVIEVPVKNDTADVEYYAGDAVDSLPPKETIHDNSENIRGVILPDTSKFYVIVGSSKDYDFAYRIWSNYKEDFPSLQIIKFGKSLYRIGFMAGTNELDAVSALRDAIEIRNDAWLIRPGFH
ncbi:hypothetical protein GYB22_02615 [bacterium]|nr:hypothetical protein [bacterium]